MLNRTPGPRFPTVEEQAAEDRRIEVAAARETALDMALRTDAAPDGPFAIIAAASRLEAVLLAHPASGQQALECVMTMFARAIASGRRADAPVGEVAATARRFACYLETGRADAD